MPVRRSLVTLSCAALAAAGLVAATGGGAGVGAAGAADAAPDPILAAIAASSAPGHPWTPAPATYKIAKQTDVPVRMADGTVLRATIGTPADPVTGRAARGPFPVLLTQTPYGKDSAGASGSTAIGISPYFIKRGYIDVAVDVRGTGDSGGTFTLFDPKQVKDGVQLVNWAAALPHSSGVVGLHGASYLGIDQMLTAGAVGADSPLKAIFPIVPAHDVYRDTAFMGGIPAAEFDLMYIGGILPLVNIISPMVDLLINPKDVLSHAESLLLHSKDLLDYNARFLLTTYYGGPQSYDTPYWHVRSPGNVLDKIVANKIPAYIVGGEYDLFQRGEPLNYAGLQNAWAGRPVTAPMAAGQKVTGRYQLLNGPFTHLGIAFFGTSVDELQLKWFDTWLKHKDTGMGQTKTPLHYYDLGTDKYAETTTYPIAGATPTTYYFTGAKSGTALSRNDGSLMRAAPTGATGADSITWAPIGSSVCDRSIDQWSAGALTVLGKAPLKAPVPCFADDRLGQIGPTALTYTTAAFSRPRTLAGPIAATIYATSNRTETQWVVNIEDVAPNGVSKPLTQGALLGSHRALDAARTWKVDGKILIPYHPHTKAAVTPVTPGAVTAYRIEVFPTYSTIKAGHRIRVTINSTDFPHLAPTPQQLMKLYGGIYHVQRRAGAASSITVPLID